MQALIQRPQGGWQCPPDEFIGDACGDASSCQCRPAMWGHLGSAPPTTPLWLWPCCACCARTASMVSVGVRLAAALAAVDANGDGVWASTRGVPCGVAWCEALGDCGAEWLVLG